MGALDGILVIALEQAVAAPLCTVRLADAGARVIKVERPEGETARHYDSAVGGTSTYFAWLNQGKESAVLDLKAEGDMALFRAMLARADVLVQNLAPGAMDRLGLGADVIARDFPTLIAANICGYGQDTEYADMKAYDILVQAESGVCAVTGTPATPSKVGAPVADLATGSNAHAAILEALIARGKTGRGQSLEISMFDSLADWMSVPLLHFEHAGTTVARDGLNHPTIQPYRPFTCQDGAILIAIQNNAQWDRFCRQALGRVDLAKRAEFATNSLRSENRAALAAELEPFFAERSLQDAIQICTAANIAWSQYRALPELAAHPALRKTKVTLADGTSVQVPRPAGRGTGFERGTLPALGQHTDAIRLEFGQRREA